MQNLKILQAFGLLYVYSDIQESLDQDFLIRNILEHPHFTNYPPATTFERSFWKWVIHTIETHGEVCMYCAVNGSAINENSGGRRAYLSSIYVFITSPVWTTAHLQLSLTYD